MSVDGPVAAVEVRLWGALEFKPVLGPRQRPSFAIELQELVEQARIAVRGQALDPDTSGASLRTLIDVGTSAGGARAKAVVAVNPDTGDLRSGQFDAPEGYTHYLLKFDVNEAQQTADTRSLTRVEYAYHRMAVAAGISMSPCRLLEHGDRAHFLTERFDRDGRTKLHMQSLCAMAHLDYKYIGTYSVEQVFGTLRTLGPDDAARSQMFRRSVFNVAARNQDDHTKNIAFLMRPETLRWELAPAYDLSFACDPQSRWNAQQFLSVNGKHSQITLADFIAVARRQDIPDARQIVREVCNVVSSWSEFAEAAGVARNRASAIKLLQDKALGRLER